MPGKTVAVFAEGYRAFNRVDGWAEAFASKYFVLVSIPLLCVDLLGEDPKQPRDLGRSPEGNIATLS
jgi:hypothetical protein